MEEWKDIANTCLQVSSRGAVRNKKTGKLRKLNFKGDGRRRYIYVRCYDRELGRRRNYYVHKLVAESFLERPEGNYEVGHISPDTTDNSIFNLEFVTRAENMKEMHYRRNVIMEKLGG